MTFSSTVNAIGFSSFVNAPVKEYHFPAQMVFEKVSEGAFGMGAWDAVAYIVKDSWLDQNREALDVFNFKEIQYEE